MYKLDKYHINLKEEKKLIKSSVTRSSDGCRQRQHEIVTERGRWRLTIRVTKRG